jgi:hypothetical protein
MKSWGKEEEKLRDKEETKFFFGFQLFLFSV